MKTNSYKYVGALILITGLLASCKQNNVVPSNSAINIINASTDIPTAAVTFANNPIPYYQQQALVNYSSSLEFGKPAGALPISLVSSTDTTHTFFSGNLNLAPGKIYSLYLCGTLPKPDTLLFQDNIPFRTDSTSGLRIINLSPDSGPLSVNLAGGATADFNPLAYKKISAFKGYPVTQAIINNGGYNYEVRDASNNVVAAFSWNNNLLPFKNYTMVISGLMANNSLQVFQVNNF
jgi:hypothetical protein